MRVSSLTSPPRRARNETEKQFFNKLLKKSELVVGRWIADEANAASEIKHDKPIMVVLGNPPYSGISANRGDWIAHLIEEYRKVNGKPLGEKKVWRADDYVKFIRFAQWRIDATGFGAIGLITNHGCLDNPTFRGMRQKLAQDFDELHILNLHGNTKKKERPPDGSKDENVFDIQRGVAIGLFVKKEDSQGRSQLCHADLWGERRAKYAFFG